MAATHKSEASFDNDNDDLSLPSTPHMRCVSRFSSWSSFHSRPSSEHASCRDLDNDSNADDTFDDETYDDDRGFTDYSQKATSMTHSATFPGSHSSPSEPSDRPLQDSDSGYGSPPAKPSHLAEALASQEQVPSFSSYASHRGQAPWTIQSDLTLHHSVEGEVIEIIAVPPESLMDCVCRVCSPPRQEADLQSPDTRAKDQIVTTQGPQDEASEASSKLEEDASRRYRKLGNTLRGLGIWMPSRSRSRR